VDEIQDFSRQETEFITLLSTKSKILAAGDDDQALYVGLKHAMPDFIRGLAIGNDYASFELPYCSRCTAVDEPDILFTNLVGSKGLSAEHVFVVGMMNGHFPRDAKAITDEEICSFLVALSRTRQQCHLISAGFFGQGFLPRSIFLSWVSDHLSEVIVDKNYNFTP